MTVALALLGWLVGVAFGIAAVAWWWPRQANRSRPWLMIVAVGAASGHALTSALYYVWLNSLTHAGLPYEVLEWAVLAAVSLGFWQTHTKASRPASTAPADKSNDSAQARRFTVGSAVAVCVCLVAVLTAVSLIAMIVADPHGRWDAWAMWNLKAKFMYLAGPRWTDLFIAAPHSDYPLLHPSAVARLWVYVGIDDPGGPRLLAWLTLLTAVGMLTAAVTHLRGAVLGAAAGLLLMTTPQVLEQAAAQYVDTTVGLFIAGALALIVTAWQSEQAQARRGLLLLAGLMAGSAAWTKNEGIAFSGMALLALGAFGLRTGVRSAWRDSVAFVLGALPMVACLLSQKLLFAGRTEVIDPGSLDRFLTQLTDLDRHRLIGQALWQVVVHEPEWVGVALAGLLVVVGGLRLDRKTMRGVALVAAVLLGQIGCWYLVYLTTQADLPWLLSTTTDRLFVQLWPGFILLLCLPARRPGVTPSPAGTAGTTDRPS